jgi:hypothetical protein
VARFKIAKIFLGPELPGSRRDRVQFRGLNLAREAEMAFRQRDD